MKRALTFLALFALVASVAAGSAQAAPLEEDRAKLVSIHKIQPGKGKGGGKPVGVANCSSDGAAPDSEYLLIGKRVTEADRTYEVTTSTIPASAEAADAGSTMSALQASFDVWRVVEPVAPPITVEPTGTATKHSANGRNEIMWGRTGGSLATAYTWRYTDGHYETDVVFDKGYTWKNLTAESDGCNENEAGNVYDVANIATHEFGHVYGLNHPNPGRYQTMYAYGYSGETLKRSPAAGDATGISLLYD